MAGAGTGTGTAAGARARAGRGKVFISHAREDTDRCAALAKWLDAWGVDYWFEARTEESGQLAQNTQMALAESAVFLRVCTPASNRSYWMSLELGTFLSLQADEQRRGTPNPRALVSLVLDSGYQRQPFDHSGPIIDAAEKPQAQWLGDLRTALGLPPEASVAEVPVAVQVPVTRSGAVTRRRVIGAGIAGAAALAVAGSTGLLLFERQHGPTHAQASGPTPKVRDPKLAWWYKTGAEILSVPALLNGTLYFGSMDKTIYALDAATGHVVWADPTNVQIPHAPAVGTQLIFFTVHGGAMIGIDPTERADSKKKWEVDDYFVGNPLTANAAGLVFSGHLDGVVAYRQDPKTAYTHAVWFADTTPSNAEPNSGVEAIALDNTTIYAGTYGGSLYAFDASNATASLPVGATNAKAKQLWVYKTGAGIYGRAGVAGGIVYVGSDDHYLHAVDAASGKRKWTFQTGDVVETAPVVANGVVYFGSADNTFYALDALSGTQVWTLKTGGATSSGTLAATVMYVASQDNYVYVVDPASGSVLHKYQTANTPTIRPVLGNGLVYTADKDGYLYAFKTS